MQVRDRKVKAMAIQSASERSIQVAAPAAPVTTPCAREHTACLGMLEHLQQFNGGEIEK
jgi:hypothetical protein